MASSIDALDLSIQLFAVGTAVGMASSLIRPHVHRDRGANLIAMESRKGMSVISMRRFLACMGASCALGAMFGLVGGLMNWSDGVAFAVLAVSGTITAAVTLRESLFGDIHISTGSRRRPRHHM